MTERRLPGGLIDADENDLIQRGPDGLWVTRSPAELVLPNVLPNKVDGVAGGNYSPSAPVSINRFDARVRATEEILLDDPASLKVAPQVKRFYLTLVSAYADTLGTPYWRYSDTGVGWSQENVDYARSLMFGLPVPQGAVISAIGARFDFSFTHSALPLSKVRVKLNRLTDTTNFVVFDIVDPSASTAAYDAGHVVVADATSTGGNLPHTCDPTSTYQLTVVGESGANSLVGMRLLSIYVDLDLRNVSPLGGL